MHLQSPVDNNIRQYIRPSIILFFLIFLTSSYALVNNIYNKIISILLFAVILGLCIGVKANGFKRSMFLMACLLMMQGITTIVNEENFLVYIMASMQLSIAGLYVRLYDWQTFKKSYIVLMTIVSAISLLFYFLVLVVPSLGSLNVIGYTLDGEPVSDYFVYVVCGIIRNGSFFWEPGAFQTFIIIALLFEFSQRDVNKYIVLVFVTALFTTFSTTGFVSLIVVLFWHYIIEGKRALGKMKAILIMLLVGAIILYYLGDLLFDTGTNSAFGKLIYAYENGLYRDNGDSTSAGIRYYAFVKPIGVFFDYPLFGAGYDNLKILTYKYAEGMNTCTFVNFFAVYGFIYALFCLIGFKKFANKIADTKNGSLWVFLILFLTTSSEDYVRNAVFYIFILYGFSNTKVNKKRKWEIVQ